MCHLDVEKCIACKTLIYRELVMCKNGKERFICIDDDAYEDNNPIIATAPDGSMVVDLKMFVHERKHFLTCKKCALVGVEQTLKSRKDMDRRRKDSLWSDSEWL